MTLPNHIHMLGICGTGMGSLATLFHEKGCRVTGTDGKVYPPMSTTLAELGIEVSEGYDPAHLEPHPDLVIIGNVISRGNPEGDTVLGKKIPYLSMSEALHNYFLHDKKPLVVAGTHGKTTTATLAAWLLDAAEEDPGFFIGGIGLNFNTGARSGSGDYFVVEGDEYDSAFFDKGPKFLHYKPHYLILNPIEFDHADIYKDIDHIIDSFKKLIPLVPKNGLIAACSDSAVVNDLLHLAKAPVITFGANDHANYRPTDVHADREGTHFTITHKGNNLTFTLPLYGRHNCINAAGVIGLLLNAGIAPAKIEKGLATFKGIKRRQEVRGVNHNVTVVDDFAHHPTAVKETIRAMRYKYPGQRLWAIFEPRSNTSRRSIFQYEFIEAFLDADKVIIAPVYNARALKKKERLNPEELVYEISLRRTEAYFIEDVEYIVEFITRNVSPNDVILVMSNGGFENIHERLLHSIARRRMHTV
jgi:UDP-N-acetylmuramate: L-alanyl-gamma-D-glutamyl-meso-diaminopimelate ligase